MAAESRGEQEDLAALERALRAEADGEVRFDTGSRAAHATDGSNYRQVPLGVVLPRTVEAGAAAVAVCSRFAAPVLSRGGGTSLGGQCTNTAVIIDWTKYCNRLLSVADNVVRLEVLTYDGVRFWAGPTSDDEYARVVAEGGPQSRLYQGLKDITGRNLAAIRRGHPKIPRRVSGYNLDSLLPENGFDVAKALVGSEGTLATVLRAELKLVEVPAAEALLVLGFGDIYQAADAVPDLLKHSRWPAQLEATDGRMARLMREEHAYLDSLEQLPEGDSWLLLQSSRDLATMRSVAVGQSLSTRRPLSRTSGRVRRSAEPLACHAYRSFGSSRPRLTRSPALPRTPAIRPPRTAMSIASPSECRSEAARTHASTCSSVTPSARQCPCVRATARPCRRGCGGPTGRRSGRRTRVRDPVSQPLLSGRSADGAEPSMSGAYAQRPA